MAILCPITVTNGNRPEYHVISAIAITDASTEITVNSWISKEGFEQGLPLCWQERYTGPAVASLQEAELLLTAAGGIFEGGVIVANLSDIEVERLRKKRAVETEMRRRAELPITIAGILLDGDRVSRDNLQAKFSEISARLSLNIETSADLLVWRDAANVTHSWPDLTSYHAWLSEFVVALSTRGTVLYQKAWAHKAAIDALKTVEAVQAYDVYQGWD